MKLNYKIYILTLVILLFSINIISAQTLTVEEITDKMDERSPDFTTQKTISEMTLIDQNGKIKEVREMISYSQKEEGDKTSSLMRFLSPKSMKGITLLSLRNGEEMRLYMPAYGQPKRITGSSKQESFMGSDLSYEDMSMDYEDKDNEKKLLQETEKEYRIEIIPSGEDTSYKKIILSVDKEIFYAKKVEFYDSSETLTKTLEIVNIKIDEQGNVTPMEIVVTDILENHKTKIVIKEIEYNIELSSDFFSLRTLKKPTL
jgi:outer membrane lipoprotein-sorting protein